MTSVARVISPIVVVAMLLSMVLMAPPLAGTVQATTSVSPTTDPVSVWTNVSPPVIWWTYYDADGDAQANYEVEVWTGSGRSGTCMWNPQQGAGTAQSVEYAGEPLDVDTVYYASVRASDGVAGWGSWSETAFCWPNISVNPIAIEEHMLTGTTRVATVVVRNNGCSTLEFDVTKVNGESWLSFTVLQDSLEPDEFTGINVTVSTSGLDEGSYYDELEVSSNDPNASPVYVPVSIEVSAPVSPSAVEEELYPGQSVDISKTLTFTPQPDIDVYYLVDDTESFEPYLDGFKDKASTVASEVAALFPDARFGLGAFRDYDTAPWGSPGDFAFQNLSNLTDVASFIGALDGLTGDGMGDELESQYEALYRVAATEPINWRDDAYKAIVLVTNSGFHDVDRADEDDDYPGTGGTEAIAALQAAGIKVFAPAINNVEEVIRVASETGGMTFNPEGPAEVPYLIINGLGVLSHEVSDPAYADWVSLSAGDFHWQNALYGVDSSEDSLYVLDRLSGDATLIGKLGGEGEFTTPVAMAIHPTDGTIYVWNNSDPDGVLLTIDPWTGQATVVGPSPASGVNIGALAFTPDGTLYGVDSDLWQINTSTGQPVLVEDLGSDITVSAAACDGWTLYGVELAASGAERLVTINRSSGLASVVGELSQDIGTIGSIAFAPNGDLIGSAFGGPLGDITFKIDPANGAVTDIRPATWSPQGMGYAPPCSSSYATASVDFVETIAVPHVGVAPGEHSFEVSYLIGATAIATQTVTITVPPSVSPATIETELYPGDCIDVVKSVWVPSLPSDLTPPVDVFLLEDETGSFGDDIANLRALAPDIFDAVRELVPDSRFGVGGFRDFPFEPWGNSWDPDWAYRLLQDFSYDRDDFVAAVNSLTAGGGNDGPESQYEALYQVATGEGVDLNGDGDYTDDGEVAPGLNPSFRADAVKVVILATDADFHNCGDWGWEFDYPGPCRDEVVQALNDAGIIVVGIEPYDIAQLHDVAEATGGVVESVSSSGAEIAEAILSALSTVVGYDEVVPQVVWDPPLTGDAPIEVSFSPEKHERVGAGTWIDFTESICVPEGTAPGVYDFTVQFLGYRTVDDEVVVDLLAEQAVAITVFDSFDWITMVYMAGDNNLGSASDDVLHAMSEATYYGPTRTVVLLDDSEKGDSAILEKTFVGMRSVDDEGAVIPEKSGEANMGDPATLEDFIAWVKANYPSTNYALVLWDHGKGWRSCNFCLDSTDGDSLSLRELGQALDGATSGGADLLQIVGFDACLMQMLEVDYQIMDYAEYAVGSEEVIPVPGWPYCSILSGLADNPGMSAAELATLICDEYAEANSGEEEAEVEEWSCYTLSAKDLSLIGDLAAAVDVFADELMSGIGTYDEEITSARAETETFGECGYWYWEQEEVLSSTGSIDLYHFASLVNGSVYGTSIATAAADVMDAVGAAVIYNVAGPEHPNANGIAIYYPDMETMWFEDIDFFETEGELQVLFYEPGYDDIDFALDNLWNEYIRTAPRCVHEGYVALFIPDVLVAAHVCQDPFIRLDWPELSGDAPGFILSKPVDVYVSPEGAIDMGLVAILYSQADLDDAGIIKTQLIGEACSDGEQWTLEKLTMDIPSWAFDLGGILSGLIGGMPGVMGEGAEELMSAVEGLSAMSDSVTQAVGCGFDYVGAVVAVPWVDLRNMAPEVYDLVPTFPRWCSAEVTSLAMIAYDRQDYLTPIQYPQNLYKGWNLVSFPVVPADADIATVLSGYGGLVEDITENVEIIWTYDAASGEWLAYSPVAPEASDLDRFEDGVGYWFKMYDDATMTVIGSNMLAGPNAPPEYDLVEGWNLLGYKGILPMPPKGGWYEPGEGWEWPIDLDGLDGYRYSEYYEEVYLGGYLEEDKVGYNRLQGYHRVYDTWYTPDFVYPNDGYWVYVVDPGSIPGLNDEVWVKAFEYGVGSWYEQTADWIGYWMMRDGELGLRLAWNTLWYAGWVIAPSELGYSSGWLDYLR